MPVNLVDLLKCKKDIESQILEISSVKSNNAEEALVFETIKNVEMNRLKNIRIDILVQLSEFSWKERAEAERFIDDENK